MGQTRGEGPLSEKSIVLIDGEHYPPVVARAISMLISSGEHPVAALLVGGGEKLGQSDVDLGVSVENVTEEPEVGLAEAIERHGVSKIIDISDEPVLGYVQRSRLASISLWKGASYTGADFTFTPPPRPRLARVPSVSVIGTGKRTGKTAVGGTTARAYDRAGLDPVVVAMGRGGPPEPEVIEDFESLTPESLLSWVTDGRHAASDYIEDALTARVKAVGAWRAGGGMAGATAHTNYEKAIERAHELDPGLLVCEGSGAAIPPLHCDAGILIVNAGIDPGHLRGYFGLYRLLLADLVVLTMVEESISRGQLTALDSCIRSTPLNEPKVAQTRFRPAPLGEVSGKKVWFATTAPRQAGEVLKRHLEEKFEAKVTGMSHSLADRSKLKTELDELSDVEVLAVELKAAAVDVVTKFGIENDIEIVYVDNQPEMIDEGGPSLDDLLLEVAGLAKERFSTQ